MRKMMIVAGLGIGALLAACTASQVTSATALATDAAAVYADLTAAQQQLTTNGTVDATSLANINTAIAKVNTDITAMNAAGASTATVTAVLADINSAIQTFGPLAPEITALLTSAGTYGSAPVATHVKQATVNSLHADLAMLHSVAGR